MAKRELKLPRRVGGVKIPKNMRKSANRLTRHFETPLGRELIAEAFVAAAGALVGSRYVRHAAADAGRELGFLLGEKKKKRKRGTVAT
jgi:hypothetical protein